MSLHTFCLASVILLCLSSSVLGGRPQAIAEISQWEGLGGNGGAGKTDSISQGEHVARDGNLSHQSSQTQAGTPTREGHQSRDQSQTREASQDKNPSSKADQRGRADLGQTADKSQTRELRQTGERQLGKAGHRLGMAYGRAGIALPADEASSSLTSLLDEATADLVTDLPGQPEAEFLQYAGYVTVNVTTGKHFFYWLTEAPVPDDKPLVLWLNGGPGCSSVGGGLMTENGPWRVSDSNATTLERNPYAWNTLANLLYLESPAGVGFSYSDTLSDLTIGDAQTAADNYAFLQGFLQRHPRYQGRPFYITGESYAGHYIPQLAKSILVNNELNDTISIPLKGFAAGNPLTEVTDDILEGPLQSYFDHALISDYTWFTIKETCNFTYDIFSSNGFAIPDTNATCNQALLDSWMEIGNVDPYDIFADSCTYLGDTLDTTNLHNFLPGLRAVRVARQQAIAQMQASAAASSSSSSASSGLTAAASSAFSLNNKACRDLWTQTYLNRRDVRQALHAKADLPYPWMECSNIVEYDYIYSFPQSIVPLYEDFIANYPDLQILVYSGDCDTVVPFVGTRKWLASLAMNLTQPYYAWYDADQVYSGLTFATVRGAGHEVPIAQPSRALTMFASFLDGKALPGPPSQFLT